MIILVRHAQSEGNKNRDIHQTTPDHRVKLTPEGHRQAQEAGRRLRDLLRPDDTLHFFTSPYRRTRETTEGMLESLTSDTPSPSPFPRHTIKVYEEPRLREQDFGNFQPCSTEMERMWMERADYGHFFYRIPNGESAADAYDRVSGFNESLWRLFGEQDFASVCILVTHGLMARVFMMKWYHWSVEYFEDLRNINHCEFVVMTHNPDNGKYTLQNKLRTWSDLRKEREAERDRERIAKGLNPAPITPRDHAPIRRKWGGCPDGCTHGLSADAKRSLRDKLIASMRHEGGFPRRIADDHLHNTINTLPEQPSPLKYASKPSDSLDIVSIPPAYDAPRDTTSSASSTHLTREDESAANYSKARDSNSAPRPNDLSHPKRPNLQGLQRDSEDHLLHPPASASSSSTACLKLALLHLGGRDGGGSMSGANSLAPSDDEGDDHDHSHIHHHQGHRPKTEISHLAPPSQDLADDGDDELSANPTEELKRARPHHHHHQHHVHPLHSHLHPHSHPHTHNHNHNHTHNTQSHHRHTTSTSQPQYRMANILGDGDDVSTRSEAQAPELPEVQNGTGPSKTASLEEQQREDQSIQGSVY